MGYDYESHPQGVKIENNQFNVSQQTVARAIKDALGYKRSLTILEIGCGGGRNLFYFKKSFGVKVRVYGTDISQTAIAQANKLKIGQFRVCVSKVIPFKEKFDFVLIIDLLEHLSSRSEAAETLKNAIACLKDKKSLAFVSIPLELNPFTFTWAYSKFPYFRQMTKLFFGHTLQFSDTGFRRLLKQNHFKQKSYFYSVFFVNQLQTLFFFFVPKTILRFFFGEAILKKTSDSAEALAAGPRSMLLLVKSIYVKLGQLFSRLAFWEYLIRKNFSFGAGNGHYWLVKK